ncbi:uncharacterized protein IL334_002980 [Kwoniella shivajii]|uniref:Type I phosphodiesterase/nucleotide pyrophosphatase n=1 Tax=Kwoniella shivajii TaxID=564305 RepID=A0ABZ1CXI6_9TREE|nr:hypothetical protein IL334_002980 [Kwoniella shivajii]
MPISPKAKGKLKVTPHSTEASAYSRFSDSSSEDDDLIIYPPRDAQHDGSENDGYELSQEREGLLGRSKDRATFESMGVNDGKRRQGWINISGFSLPRPLIYLLSIPPTLLFLSFLARTFSSSANARSPTLSNGTHPFHPTVLLISLDGFRPSYLSSHYDLLPNLLSLSTSEWGLRAESMQPVFPTLTFPNHWALMTGLHPESHGIIANDFWDPQFPVKSLEGDDSQGAQFVYVKEDKSWDSNWWWGEPIWSVVERAKRKSAVIMWPGPPITSAGISPSYFVPYRKMKPTDKVHQILSYLDLPIEDRPEFIASYFPEIDQSGHKGGPKSGGVNNSLSLCDDMIGELRSGLQDRNLEGAIDVVIVSDHGMAETSNDRVIYLDDILGDEGVDAIEHKDGWPSVGLRFKEGMDTDHYLQLLLDAAESSNGTFAVYTHDTMPERWHFSHGHRIAPIYIVPTLGWAITDHHEHEVLFDGDYRPKGNHGYDNTFPEMQAIFVAQGPFASQLKSSASSEVILSRDPPIMKSFKNLEIFSLVTGLLGLSSIEPSHNGTVGFWDNLV